ncbi:stalk domain-containing protein [Ammoniphilus sp. 3BR4]|uniref:stalk domain-containing protein n=1 Tax=Ammoniphilus sp. 3BR4 TaxID=3158265 RepID=UPI0034652046
MAILLVGLWCFTPFPIQAESSDWDAEPYIEIQSKRTMVPVRFVSEELGASVKWNPQTRTVHLKAAGNTIVLTIGQAEAVVNGRSEMLDTKALIRNDRTYVPLRFISETFGAKVEWIGQEKKVIVKTEMKTIEMKIKQWEGIAGGMVIGQVDPHSIELETKNGTQVFQLSNDVMKLGKQWKEGSILLFKSYVDEHKRNMITEIIEEGPSTSQQAENERFAKIKIYQHDGSYWVMGVARVFEGVMGYVVEDGHYELAKGFDTTSRGAPEWGLFMFRLDVSKARPNSTLTLVLYEESPKDGKRQFELLLPLP